MPKFTPKQYLTISSENKSAKDLKRFNSSKYSAKYREKKRSNEKNDKNYLDLSKHSIIFGHH